MVKSNLIQTLIIYFISMSAIFIIKPSEIYKEDGETLKGWEEIDFEKTESLYNIYIISICLAIISFFISNEL
jgi:hypothetical protein